MACNAAALAAPQLQLASSSPLSLGSLRTVAVRVQADSARAAAAVADVAAAVAALQAQRAAQRERLAALEAATAAAERGRVQAFKAPHAAAASAPPAAAARPSGQPVTKAGASFRHAAHAQDEVLESSACEPVSGAQGLAPGTPNLAPAGNTVAGRVGAQGFTRAGRPASGGAPTPAASAAVGAGPGEATQGSPRSWVLAATPVVDAGVAAASEGVADSSRAASATPASVQSVAAPARQRSARAPAGAEEAAMAVSLAAEGVPGAPALGSGSVQPAALQPPMAAAPIVRPRQAGGEQEADEGFTNPVLNQQPAPPAALHSHSQAAGEPGSSGCAEPTGVLAAPCTAAPATLSPGALSTHAAQEPLGDGRAGLTGAPCAARSAWASSLQVPEADPEADPAPPAGAAGGAGAAGVQVPSADPRADPAPLARAPSGAGAAGTCEEASAMSSFDNPAPHAAWAARERLAAVGCQAEALRAALCAIGTQYSEQEEAVVPAVSAHANPTSAAVDPDPAKGLGVAAGAAPGDEAAGAGGSAQGADASLEGICSGRSPADSLAFADTHALMAWGGKPAECAEGRAEARREAAAPEPAAAANAHAVWSRGPMGASDGRVDATQEAGAPELGSEACAAAVGAAIAPAPGSPGGGPQLAGVASAGVVGAPTASPPANVGFGPQPAGEQEPPAWTPSRSCSLPSPTRAGLRSGSGLVGCGAPSRQGAGAPEPWPQTLGERPEPGCMGPQLGYWRPRSAGAGPGVGPTGAGAPLRRLSSAPEDGCAWGQAPGGAWAPPGPRAHWPALPQVPFLDIP